MTRMQILRIASQHKLAVCLKDAATQMYDNYPWKEKRFGSVNRKSG